MHSKSRSIYAMFAALIALVMALSACQPAATVTPTLVPTLVEEPTAVPQPTATTVPEPTEVPEPAIGSAEHPIKVLFVPSTDAAIIVTGGEVMADALKEATGLEFTVSVPTSYAATIEEMCASPTDTMGFIPGQGYVIANQLCGVDVSFKAIRNGLSVYYAQFIVQRDSDIQELSDLEGKKWGFGDVSSTSGYLVPAFMLEEAGITPGEQLETGGHNQTVSAVYNGEVDFGTTFFSPPLVEGATEPWKEGDPVDVPDDLLEDCAVTEDGSNIICGEYTVLDARRNIRTEAADVVQQVRILDISPAIPNDTLSFGPEFPAELRAQIETALVAFAKTDAWNESIGKRDMYGWSGLDVATDEEFDVLRSLNEALGINAENYGQ